MTSHPSWLKSKRVAARLVQNLHCSGGNFGMLAALMLPVLVVAAGGAVDLANAFAEKSHLQEKLDAGVIAAAA